MRLYLYLIANRLALVIATPLSQILDTNYPIYDETWKEAPTEGVPGIASNPLPWNEASTEGVPGIVSDPLPDDPYPIIAPNDPIVTPNRQPLTFDLAKTPSVSDTGPAAAEPKEVGVCCTGSLYNDDVKTCQLSKPSTSINLVTRSPFLGDEEATKGIKSAMVD
ncbi:hypothetical protein MMC07_008698 [Pseudocyphellaria aurata]|nr:hypothetical protein [Pseudocyphellaria aurata]